MFWTAQSVADLVYHRAKFGAAGTWHATRRAKSLMFFCLFVFTSVTLLDRVCERHVTMNESELRNKFGIVG